MRKNGIVVMGAKEREQAKTMTSLINEENGTSDSPLYPVASVDRTLRLIKLLGTEQNLRLADIRDALEIGQSTAHRLVSMLCHHGFAVQNPATRSYHAGPALMEVGFAAVSNLDIREIARPHLERLAEVSGETVHLSSLERAEVRFIDGIESESTVRVSSRVGKLSPAHATAVGKAMLATLSEEQLIKLFPEEELLSVTDRTLRTKSGLLKECIHIRNQGFATSDGESEREVSSVGVAIVTRTGTLLGGLSISTPASRFTSEKRRNFATLLTSTSEEINNVSELP